MQRRRVTPNRPWERKVAADPDVIVTDDEVRVRRRPGESKEEFRARFRAAVPPFSEEQKRVIRAAADEFWQTMRERAQQKRMRRERRKRDRRKRADRRKRQIPIKGPDRRLMVDRRSGSDRRMIAL